MKRITFLLFSTLLLMSCSEGSQDDRNEKYQPIALSQSQKEITVGVNSLAFNLLDYVVQPANNKDTFISPFSLSACLSLIANGADSTTLEQMMAVLGFEGKSLEELNDYYELILNALSKADRKVDFLSANSVWVAPGLELYDDYVGRVEESYMAEVDNVDFSTQEGIDRINRWCSNHTNGKISKFLERPDNQLRLLLANALYFNGSWQDEFKVVLPRTFTHADGSTSTYDSMVATRQLAYYSDASISCVEIPYGNGAYVMDLILPNTSAAIDATAAYLQQENVWQQVVQGLTHKNVALRFPKFRIENSVEMTKMLKSLGMPEAFTPMADFSKMSPSELMLSWVLQKSYVDVTEKGTTAAAVTGGGMIDSAAPPFDAVEFIADRPFFFLIRERSTGVVIFVGLKA